MCLVSFARTPHYAALEKLKRWDGNPKWAYIAVCSDCSHRCSWCFGGFNEARSHQMSVADFECVLGKLRAIGVRQVTLAGGEPTEHADFATLVKLGQAHSFNLHVASHGGHIDQNMAEFLAHHGVRQVQLNWQGRAHHDHIHKTPGAHARSRRAMRCLVEVGIEVTATVTVGRYNLPDLPDIFREAVELGVTRLRVWETTGRGNAFLRGVEVKEIFSNAREAAAALGFGHVLSYEPLFEGDVSVPCPQLSKLIMHVTHEGRLNFCSALADPLPIADFLDPNESADVILARYLQANALIKAEREYFCAARGEGPVPLAEAWNRPSNGEFHDVPVS